MNRGLNADFDAERGEYDEPQTQSPASPPKRRRGIIGPKPPRPPGQRNKRPRGGKRKHWHSGMHFAREYSTYAESEFFARYPQPEEFTKEDLDLFTEEFLEHLHDAGVERFGDRMKSVVIGERLKRSPY